MRHIFVIFFWIAVLAVKAQAANEPIVDIQTNLGSITVQLAPDKAPITVNNFLTYVHEGFYNDTIFHRVIPGFMIQGGGFSTSYTQKATHNPIKLESNNGLPNIRGSIAMARTDAPDSATAQFFINTVDNSQNFAPPGYAVFGQVLSGMEVVDKISSQRTSGNVPVNQVIIQTIRLRQAQLSFINVKASYSPGDSIQIELQEDTIQRQQAFDLWVAILNPNNQVIFISPENLYLLYTTPKPFKRAVPSAETHHSILQLTIPPGLAGKYTLLALYNAPGSDLNNLTASLRSNIASATLELK